jgi:pilus assembly protein CpaF
MYAVFVAEKGGPERRETFTKSELTFGRVAGNDLVLPKGNVSKQHAKLLLKDGRFIVSDLKSTNGTYVNGRKITQATIVREGDKVYLGDFVIRLEALEEGAEDGDVTKGREENPLVQAPAIADGRSSRPPPPLLTEQPPRSIPPPLPNPAQGPAFPPPGFSGPGAVGPGAVGPGAVGPGAVGPGIAGMPPLPGAPLAGAPAVGPGARKPLPGPRPGTVPMNTPEKPNPATPGPSAAARGQEPGAPEPVVPLRRPSVAPPAVAPLAAPSNLGSGPSLSGPPTQAQESRADAQVIGFPRTNVPVGPPAAPPAGTVPLAPVIAFPAPGPAIASGGNGAGRYLALIALTRRLRERVPAALGGEGSQAGLESLIREQIAQMRGGGELAESADAEALVRDAMSELVGVGPLAALLEEPSISEIHVVRSDRVVVRRSGRTEPVELGITSEAAAVRIAQRIHPYLEFRGLSGVEVAIGERGALSLWKRTSLDGPLEDWAQGPGARPLVAFLEAAMLGGLNILVCGVDKFSTERALAALAMTIPAGARVCALLPSLSVSAPQVHCSHFSCSDSGLQAALRLLPDQVVLLATTAPMLATAVSNAHAGSFLCGVASSAEGSAQAMERMAGSLAVERAGVGIDSARAAIFSGFDLVVELRSNEGKSQIARVSESKDGALQDVFVSRGQGLTATGVVPRVLSVLQSRGAKIDANIFGA